MFRQGSTTCWGYHLSLFFKGGAPQDGGFHFLLPFSPTTGTHIPEVVKTPRSWARGSELGRGDSSQVLRMPPAFGFLVKAFERMRSLGSCFFKLLLISFGRTTNMASVSCWFSLYTIKRVPTQRRPPLLASSQVFWLRFACQSQKDTRLPGFLALVEHVMGGPLVMEPASAR